VEASDDLGLIGPDEPAYRLELTAAELKVTYTALRALMNDFGHDEYDVQRIVRGGVSVSFILFPRSEYAHRIQHPRRVEGLFDPLHDLP
jgi:hypothetical protein